MKKELAEALAKCKVARVEVTRYGNEYNVLDVTESKEFWDLWKGHKDDVRSLGITVFRLKDKWLARDFRQFEYDCSKKVSRERSKANLEKAREVKSKHDVQRREEVAQSLGLPKDIDAKELAKIKSALKTLKEAGLLK